MSKPAFSHVLDPQKRRQLLLERARVTHMLAVGLRALVVDNPTTSAKFEKGWFSWLF